jgi:cytochrome c553
MQSSTSKGVFAGMRVGYFILLALLAASRAAGAADIAAGKELAAGCAGCHGEDGISRTALTASLAGEPDDFVQWQLVFFRSARRKNDVMESVAGALSNEDIRNLGAYYASLPPPKRAAGSAAPADDKLAQEGAALAKQHHCRSCHGDDFEGAGPAARLAGQREDVLVKALQDYKSGARIAPGVASMADVVYDLNDADMHALAHFMATRD